MTCILISGLWRLISFTGRRLAGALLTTNERSTIPDGSVHHNYVSQQSRWTTVVIVLVYTHSQDFNRQYQSRRQDLFAARCSLSTNSINRTRFFSTAALASSLKLIALVSIFALHLFACLLTVLCIVCSLLTACTFTFLQVFSHSCSFPEVIQCQSAHRSVRTHSIRRS